MSVTDLSKALSADAFRWGALGKTAWRVFRLLVVIGPTTERELRERLQMVPKTLRRALDRLGQQGFAQLIDGAWHPAAADLQAAARQLGTLGAADRQRQEHEQERIAYRELLAFRHRRRNQSRTARSPEHPGST